MVSNNNSFHTLRKKQSGADLSSGSAGAPSIWCRPQDSSGKLATTSAMHATIRSFACMCQHNRLKKKHHKTSNKIRKTQNHSCAEKESWTGAHAQVAAKWQDCQRPMSFLSTDFLYTHNHVISKTRLNQLCHKIWWPTVHRSNTFG